MRPILSLHKEFELSAAEAAQISILRFSPRGANSYRILLNGVDAGFLYAGKFALNTGRLLKTGKNTLTVELTLSLRNMLGPHHLAEGESYKVTTLSFCKEANAIGWQPPEFADGYCMVDVGMDSLEFA